MTSLDNIVRYDCLYDNEIFTYWEGEDYTLDTIVFRNWGEYGICIMSNDLVTEEDEMVFYQKRYLDIEWYFSLREHGIKCCGNYKFLVIDPYTDNILRVFKIEILGDGDGCN